MRVKPCGQPSEDETPRFPHDAPLSGKVLGEVEQDLAVPAADLLRKGPETRVEQSRSHAPSRRGTNSASRGPTASAAALIRSVSVVAALTPAAVRRK